MDNQTNHETVVQEQPVIHTATSSQSNSQKARLVIVGIVMLLIGLGWGYILFAENTKTVIKYPNSTSPTTVTSDTNISVSPTLASLPLLHIKPAQINNWSTYVDPNFHYSFKYSPTWELSPPISSNKILSDKYLDSPRYVSYLQIKNTISPKDSDLSMAVELNNNSKHITLSKWVDNALKDSSIVYKKEKLTVDGNEAIRTRINPSFENVFINYISPDKTQDLFIEMRFMGNGEGSSKFYQDNDPFVLQEWSNFEALVDSFTFSK